MPGAIQPFFQINNATGVIAHDLPGNAGQVGAELSDVGDRGHALRIQGWTEILSEDALIRSAALCRSDQL